MTINYAISEWPDAKPIYEKLDNLVKTPQRSIKAEAMTRFLNYFEEKCVKSKEITTRAKKFIPGGVQHNLAFNYPFPIAIGKADGAFMWDMDGNKYIDFLQAGGPTVLGSNYKPVQDKVIEVIKECGPITGLFHEYELKLAELVNQYMPSVEMFRMLGSGSESAMAAIRLARTYNSKKKIIKIGGAYHGWSDQLVYGLHVPGTGAMEAVGIPKGCNSWTIEVPPNNIEELEKQLEKNVSKGGTAAILLEPIGPESGTHPVYRDYDKQVRELCDKYETLLIFDEVVTGFRLGMGGAQGYFRIKPDITIFGKCIAGGYPMAGGIGGSEEIMKFTAAGVETGSKRAYVGGTLSANPLSCVAGYWAIKEMDEQDAAVKAGRAGDKLRKGLQKMIDQYNLPYVTWNHGSIVHLETSGAMLINIMEPGALKEAMSRKELMEHMGAAFMANGIITLAGSRIYTSMADTDDVIDDALRRFDNVLSQAE